MNILRKTCFKYFLYVVTLLYATKLHPSNDSLLMVWGDSLITAEERLKALVYYTQILKNKHPDSCIQYIDKGIQLSQQTDLNDYFMQLSLIKGFIYTTNNEYTLAEKIYKNVIDIGITEENYKYVGSAYSYWALDKFHQGLIEEAEELFRSSFEAIDKVSEPERSSRLGNSYIKYSTMFANSGDFQKAIELSRKASVLLKNKPYERNVALGNIGVFYQNLGNYDSALNYYNQIVLDTNNKVATARTKFNMSVILEESSLLDSALKLVTEANRLYTSLNHKIGQAATLNGIASIYARRGEYELSHEHLDRAIEICTPINLIYVLTTLHVNKGEYYSRQNLIDKANNSFLKALKLAKKIKKKTTVGEVYLGLGANFDKKENFEEAIKYYELAAKVFEETGEVMKICMAKTRAGYSYFNMNDAKGSISIFREALKIATSNDNLERVMLGLALAYELDSQWDSAYKYMEKTLIIRDSLLAQNNLELEKEIRAKFELDYAEEKVRLIEKKLATKKESERIWNWLLISVIFVVLITLIVLNRQLKLTEEKRKVAEMALILSKKERENKIELLRNQSATILDKNSLINSLKYQVKVIMRQAGISETPENIYELMNRKVLTNGDWERFRVYFQAAYPVYFEAINKQFPKLSRAEERFLCLYKFEISEEEMANTLAISKDSLQKTKRRLRSKYNISDDENLFNILNSFS